MNKILDFLLVLLVKFGGGSGKVEDNLVRFGLAALFWGVLLAVAWSRQRQHDLPREKLLVWGFGLGLAREALMFCIVAVQMMGLVSSETVYVFFPPLELALGIASVTVVAASFLRYILDDANLSRRYLQIGLGAASVCYLAAFGGWASHITANPEIRFSQTWAAWLLRLAGAGLTAIPIALLIRKKGWLRNIVLVALTFFFLDEFLMLFSLATRGVYKSYLCPISHSFHIWAIPVLGYVYIREQSIERKRAEDALRESEERFRGIIENTQAGYFYVDRDGRFQHVNAAWLQMHGYTLTEQVIGQHLALVQLERNREQTEQDLTKLLAGERLPTGRFTRRRQDGSTGYHTSSVNPVVQGGKVVGLEGFLIDLTEWVRAEREVWRHNEELVVLNAIAATISQSQDLERMLNAVLDKVLQVMNTDAGWIQLLDEEQDVLLLVAQRGFEQETQTVKLGQGLTGQVAQSGRPMVVDELADSPWPEMEAARQQGIHSIASVPIQSKDKTLGVLSVFSHKQSVQKVELVRAIAHQVGVAVENARLAEEASRVEILQELNRLRSELIANVSHEVRTPLGLIKISSTSLLAKDVEFDPETRREFLRGIDQETDRLEKIVDNLLDLSQIENRRLHLDKHPTDVAQLVRDVIQSLQVQTTQHRLLCDLADPLVAVIDSKRIEQTLRNLLSNAIKYSPAGGAITIWGREDKRQLVIQVSDQGIGIPSEDLERVFERFYRVENETTRNAGGVGLGLPICRSIAQAHGGRIWVESAPGLGSTFHLTLPLGDRSIAPAQQLAQDAVE